ncbi:MAG: two component transcriptional regulator, winged helix family [Labilithrix sp.]|nr:two component transcriptional regulator, winged helix family [Labilithrix sp.]
MRSVVFRFEDIARFSAALGDARGSLALPEGETVTDGEWILAIFEIGSKRRATAAAARAVCAAGDPHVAFERRDWDRLLQFVAARSESRSEHMRAARPVAAPASLPLPVTPAIGFSDNDNPPSSVVESSRLPFGARILLVDDDDAAREELRQMLTDIGMFVEVAGTAAEAEQRVLDATFDALVLDFHTPGMEPLEFVRSLHRGPRGPLPVLFLGGGRGQPTSRDVVDAFASGADDFLPKPFRAPELAARIFGLLRRARLAKAGSIAPGPTSRRGGLS